MTITLNRRAFCGGLAGAAIARPAWAATDPLIAQKASVQLAPEGYPATPVWSYGGSIPGPLIRVPQGGRVTRRLVNDLEVPTSVHWHGIRIDNAMDGVAGLTQDAVPPGETFDYDFAVPDAGTYWYHAHTNSMEQVARGLSGVLIVDEATPPDVDRDEVLMLDDWLLDPDTGSFVEPFTHPMMMSHGGRTGNLIGVNGQYAYRMQAETGERLRLRLINAANARIFGLKLDGMTGWTVALDGMPLDTPEKVSGEIVLAPAQRVDLIVDITATDGPAGLLMSLDGDTWEALVDVSITGTRPPRDTAPAPLPANPNTALPDLSQARALDMVMEGGAMAGMDSALFQGDRLDFRALIDRGQFWALAGQAGLSETPFAELSRGEVVRVRLDNRTAFPHGMHLHGMHFREVRADGAMGPLRDTILSIPNTPLEIAFTADNPGKWLLHCHMLAHAASGMTTWINVS
ncbi:multicopper oxidase family protein [Tropicibacter naphthalenivorans]|uniref:Multicopper oxidase mco n=1 Tax=Tropicibacter naphthalenivorans TaxID=441103 RepID=A0A0P1GH22_9RHOB|nr:multicopper oxidase family protein [Tropicibacter naphthalenivorans]CUH80631.1 Multicopper oxidase mco [Tropicibacter naphthalenivorans]SMC89108.1 Multicopper oxidase with three cupredoxin domains (includes cell division protein FtsP and spore coat protein CotA) [Tropicibacter naphthalenivorans]